MVATNRIICIWYNNPFPHPQSPPTWSFVFDTTTHFHIHGHHQQDRLYLIQWSTSTSTSMLATPMIICIWYNDPPRHQASSLPWSFIIDTTILWSSWYLFYSLHSSPSSHNEVLTSSGLQHLCLALVSSDLLKPNDSMNLVNFGLGRGLVKISETLSSIGTYFTWILPSLTTSRMKWYHRSMCFVLAWNLLSFASMMAPWLSHEMVSSFSSPPWISFIKLLSQIPSLATCVCMTYSASVLDSDTTPCFLELHEIAPTPKWNENPDIECLWFWLAQSALLPSFPFVLWR